MIRSLHIIQGYVKHESRILKESQSLIDAQLVDEILIVGFGNSELPRRQFVAENIFIERIPLFFGKFRISSAIRILMLIEFYLKTFLKYMFVSIHVIQSHSIEVLPLGVALSIVKPKSNLLYDAHELETEKSDITGVLQKIYRVIERNLIHFPSEIYVVSYKIAEWYKSKYNVSNIEVVRNIPIKYEEELGVALDLREKFEIGEHDLLFIMQGGLVVDRNIDLLLEVFSTLNSSQHILFMGNGPFEEKIKQYARDFSNIHYLSAVPHNEVLLYTKQADVGICLIENICLSYYYSLPNKFFEYVLAEVPVLFSNFPEMADFNKKYGIGHGVKETKEGLIFGLNHLDRETILQYKQNCKVAINNISWNKEVQVLLDKHQEFKRSW